MANEEHLAILKQGVETWNEWQAEGKTFDRLLEELRGGHPDYPDLSGANLNGANLRNADFTSVNLRNADLNDADLAGADLSYANLVVANVGHATLCRAYLSRTQLRGANLARSNLAGANLVRANLSGANLSDTRLNQCNLSDANLTSADLGGMILDSTTFGNTDLSDVKGLEKCRFQGPCTLDHRTIQKSGRLPLAFLRGCGLPDALIDYLPSLLNLPIQYYSCFISYSSIDDEFARRLHADLQNNGVRCWFAPHDIAGGKKVHEQIEEAIRRYERLLLILSEHSMGSDWVATEIANAREREEAEKRQVLFPIRLVDYERIKTWKCCDADRGKDSAKEIREYFIPDFTNWNDHDAYTASFERLLKDLKAESRSREPG